MENNENSNQTLSASLCTAGCGFFGNAQFDGMCSQCYKDALKRKQAAANPDASSIHASSSSSSAVSSTVFSLTTAKTTVPVPSVDTSIHDNAEGATAASPSPSVDSAVADPLSPPPTPSTDSKTKKRNRCTTCKKRVGLTGFACRCGGLFCGLHRYSDKHDCQYDYKKEGEEMIRKNNPVVVGEKLQKI